MNEPTCPECRKRDEAYQRRYDLLVDEIIRLQTIVESYEPSEFPKGYTTAKEYREQTQSR